MLYLVEGVFCFLLIVSLLCTPVEHCQIDAQSGVGATGIITLGDGSAQGSAADLGGTPQFSVRESF